MRHYNIKRIKTGGHRFTCVHCEHYVSTLDFMLVNGNLRTQAAAAINRHNAKEHIAIAFTPIRLAPVKAGSLVNGWPRPIQGVRGYLTMPYKGS